MSEPATTSITGTVVVTGAATGVGRALALEAAARGANVFALDIDDPAETIDMITGRGANATGAVVDIRDADAMQKAADAICGPEGSVIMVCANAGIGRLGTIAESSAQDFREVIELNVLGTIHTIHAFLPALRRAASDGAAPRIMITGSEHSLGVPPYVAPLTAYTTSKHALLGLAACIRRDLAADSIGVSLLCPGYVRTERISAHAASDPSAEAYLSQLWQEPEVVARRGFDGAAMDEFVNPTNPVSRDFVVAAATEIIAAMEAVTSR